MPELDKDQRDQLHMIEELNLLDGEYEERVISYQKEAHCHFQSSNTEDKVYLNSCITMITFMGEKCLTNVDDQPRGLAIHCNTSLVKTKHCGKFGGSRVLSM